MSHKITVEYLKAALASIEEGRGRFSRDRLEHCTNTVEDLRKIAHDALNGEWEPDER